MSPQYCKISRKSISPSLNSPDLSSLKLLGLRNCATKSYRLRQALKVLEGHVTKIKNAPKTGGVKFSITATLVRRSCCCCCCCCCIVVRYRNDYRCYNCCCYSNSSCCYLRQRHLLQHLHLHLHLLLLHHQMHPHHRCARTAATTN